MKKLGSILVTLVFLITLIGAVPSFAAAPVGSSFTFTDLESNGTYSSNQAGYNGSSTAIKLAASGTNVRATIGTSNLTNYGFTADNSLVMTMRIKFKGAATSDYSLNANMNTSTYGHTWSIKGDGTTGKYNFKDQSGTNIPLDGDKWYNVTTHFKGIYAWTYVVDETGVQVGYKYSQTYSSAPTERPLYLWSGNTTENGLLIDDLKLYSVNTTDTFSYVAEGSTTANSEIGEDGLITVKFDQPIVPTAGSFTVAGATVDSVVAKDFNTAIVKVSGLSAGQTYALDFSAVKSVAGTALTGTSSIAFKTPAAEIEPRVVYTEDFDGTFNVDAFTSSTIFDDGQWKDNYIADTNGYNGGTTALKLTYGASSADNSNNHVKTKTLGTLGLSADTTVVFNTRFKMNGTPISGYSWSINMGGGYKIGEIKGTNDGNYSVASYTSGTPATLFGDKWYDLIVPLGTTGAVWGYIYDSATGELVVQTQGTGVTNNMPSSRLYIQTSTLTENLSMTLDDAKLYCIAKTATFSKVAGGTEENAVIGEDGLLAVKFDQPIIPTKSNFTVAGATVDSVKVKNFDTAIVKVSGITAGQSYTLDFSVIKSAAGSSLAGTSKLAFKAPAKTHFTQGYVFGTDFNADVFKSSSEIFYEGKWSDQTYSQADGYLTGENGIKIENPDDDPVADQITTKKLSSFGLTRDNVLIFTTRFKFSGKSEANTYWSIYPVTSSASLVFIGGGVDGKYYAGSEPIEADKWYNMSIAIRPDQRSVLMINDSVTGETIVYKSAKTPATSVVDNAYNFLWFQTSSLVKGTSLTLADTDIYIVSEDDTLTVDASASSPQNATITPDGTIAVQFDMPVFSNKVVGVEDAVATVSKNNFTVAGADIGEIGVIDFNKVVVGFYNLDSFEDYVLDFANIVCEGGAGLDSSSVSSIAFTVGADINNLITAGKATYANGEINLKLYSETEQSVKLYAAFYNGTTLLGVATAIGTATSAKNDSTITIDGTYENADNIRIYGWNNCLVPIMAIKNITLETEE